MSDIHDEAQETLEGLKTYPTLVIKVKEMLDRMEKKPIQNADDLEEAFIPEVRGFGKEIVKAWATQEEIALREQTSRGRAVCHSKKIHWHTPFGKIEMVEQAFLVDAKTYRSLIERLGIYCRS